VALPGLRLHPQGKALAPGNIPGGPLQALDGTRNALLQAAPQQGGGKQSQGRHQGPDHPAPGHGGPVPVPTGQQLHLAHHLVFEADFLVQGNPVPGFGEQFPASPALVPVTVVTGERMTRRIGNLDRQHSGVEGQGPQGIHRRPGVVEHQGSFQVAGGHVHEGGEIFPIQGLHLMNPVDQGQGSVNT